MDVKNDTRIYFCLSMQAFRTLLDKMERAAGARERGMGSLTCPRRGGMIPTKALVAQRSFK